MKVILCANMKGGVGKTTTALMLAWCAQQSQQKVTLVDLDLNAQLSRTLNCWSPQQKGFLGLEKQAPELQPISLPALNQHTCFPAPGESVWIDTPIPRSVNPLQKLKDTAQEQGSEWLILDTPSGYFPLLSSALAISDLLIAPTQMSAPQRRATVSYLKRMALLGLRDRRKLSVKLLPILWSDHIRSHQIGLNALQQQIGQKRVLTPIHTDRHLENLSEIFKNPSPDRLTKGMEDYLLNFKQIQPVKETI